VNIDNRRSLHLDYTRAMEKTPTPINTECTRAPTRLDSSCMSPRDLDAARCKSANRPTRAMESADPTKTLMESAFSRMPKKREFIRAQRKNLRHPQPPSAANRAPVSLPPKAKIFSTDRASEALRRP
jgi:hypothetical protein